MNQISLICITFCLMLVTGCGMPAKARNQENITVSAPDYPKITDNVFALKDGKRSVSYKSTMLIMNPFGSPTQLAELIRASEMTRISAADAKKFIGNEEEFDKRYGDNGSLSSLIKNHQTELAHFLTTAQERSVPIPKDTRKIFATNWFDDQLLKIGLNPEDMRIFEVNWSNYCDAKVIELASQPYFAFLSSKEMNGYKKRPSPMQFCEPYYSTKGYFQGESCKNGDYFTCLWVDGVQKINQISPDVNPILQSKISSVFDDPLKIDAFNKILTADSTLTRPHITGAISSAVASSLFRDKTFFYKAILEGKPSVGTEKTCVNLLSPEYSFICGTLAKTWKSKAPQSYITDIEFNSGLIIDKKSDDLKFLSEVIKYFGKRPIDGVPNSSNSDFYFQESKIDQMSQPKTEKMGLSQNILTRIFDTFLDKIFSLNSTDREEKNRLEDKINRMESELKLRRLERNRLSESASDALQTGIKAANNGNIAFGFVAYRMTVTHFGEYIRASISFEGHSSEIFEGCYDKAKKSSAECPAALAEGSGETKMKANLSLNPSKGRIEFSFNVADARQIGLGYNPKKVQSPDYFMDLMDSDIDGLNLRFELYPNRLENSLDILTGKALFLRNDQTVYEAGVSMWEE